MGKQEIKIENVNPVSPSQVYLRSSQSNPLIGEEFATWGFLVGEGEEKKLMLGTFYPGRIALTTNSISVPNWECWVAVTGKVVTFVPIPGGFRKRLSCQISVLQLSTGGLNGFEGLCLASGPVTWGLPRVIAQNAYSAPLCLGWTPDWCLCPRGSPGAAWSCSAWLRLSLGNVCECSVLISFSIQLKIWR